jgi:hypothetical protein
MDSSSASDTSTLRKFERSLQSQGQASTRPATISDQSSHNNLRSGAGFNLSDDFTNWLGELGQETWQRLDPESSNVTWRKHGDFTIPFIRYDFAYQHVAYNIHADSHRVEAGYGPFAILLEDYTFSESAPDNKLTSSRQLLLYRMSAVPMFEVDIGLGQTTITDVQKTTFGTFSMPVRIVLGENMDVEFRPAWAGTLSDYELALHLGQQYGSVKLGYRTLNSPDSSLGGPFLGISVYY